jgi:hypothetical protein
LFEYTDYFPEWLLLVQNVTLEFVRKVKEREKKKSRIILIGIDKAKRIILTYMNK